MPFRGRATGTYFDAKSIKSKLSGSYVAIQNVFAKIAGAYTKVDIPSMMLGVNGTWTTTWQGAWQFNNLCMTMDVWKRQSGAATFTQLQGTLTPSDNTSEFRAYLADTGGGLPSGTYTVYNPDGCNIAVGNFSTPTTFHAYTTATQFTFTYNNGDGFLGLWCKGPITRNNGNLAVIMPGQTTAYLAGDYWNSEYLTYVQDLKPTVVRLLDWNGASANYEAEWSDRCLPNQISHTKYESAQIVPWEVMADFANRVGCDIWINLPARVSSDYVTNLASVLNARLHSDREVWVEHANEVWNTSAPWSDGLEWITRLNHTRFTATVSNQASGIYQLVGHGMAENDQVKCFSTLENRYAFASVNSQARYGSTAWVHVVDADHFTLLTTSGGSTIPIASTQVNLIFIKLAEAGKVADRDGFYVQLTLRNWDILDATLGAKRVKHVCGSFSAQPTYTQNRLGADAQMPTRTDYIAIAPYMYGAIFGSRATPAATQVTPGFWGNSDYGPYTVTHGLYAQGSTPSIAEVVAGTGTGFVAQKTQTFNSGSYVDTTAITGLANGTTYTMVTVVQETSGRRWKFQVDVTPQASGNVTTYGYDTYANQATRNLISAINESAVQVTNHQSVSQGIPIVCYEGGLHFAYSPPSQMVTWQGLYQESSEHADALKKYLYLLASKGVALFNYYAECSGNFSLSTTYQDTVDNRYVTYKNLLGNPRKRTQVSVNNQSPAFVTQPGGYPATVHTMADNTLTYLVYSGDNNGNYSFNGANLQIVNGNGITWAASASVTLKCLATDGYTFKLFDVSFFVGTPTWYEADALFAWSSIDDSNNANIDPAIGNQVPLTAGTGATIASGLWDMNANTYQSNTAFPNTFNTTGAVLFAFVIAKDDQPATSGKNLVQFSSGSQFIRIMYDGASGGDKFYPRIFANGVFDITSPATLKFGADLPATKSVCWIYYDADATTPTWHAGVNQTEVSSTNQSASGLTWGQFFRFGGAANDSNCLHGSVQVVRRDGLTLAQAKAIVQNMQTHHGI